MELPADMVAEILSRTPVKTIVYCKCVCKRWRSILSEPYFANLHLSRSPEILLLHQGNNENEYSELAVVELDDNRGQHVIYHGPLMRFNLGLEFEFDVMCLSGSINGLICIEDNYVDSVYICNPITQEYILLQDSEYPRESFLKGYYGFGFVESNNQYKVVRFYKCSSPSIDGSYNLGSEIYTLGTGMWRDLGRIPFHLNGCDIGMYVNGNLHWLADEVICTFDLDRELFQPMEAAPLASGQSVTFRSLGVLKGFLCICDNTPYSELSIWVMRDYGVEHSWSKELVTLTHLIHGGIDTDMVRLLKVLEDGSILMFSERFQLFTYHRRYEILQHHIFPDDGFDTFDTITYVPSFISLQNFMVEDVLVW